MPNRQSGNDAETDDPPTLKAPPSWRCTKDIWRRLSAASGCRNGRYAVNGIFSCHAPSMQRSRRRRNEPQFRECPGAGLRAEPGSERPAPGRHAPFPCKPRNLYVCIHVHTFHIYVYFWNSSLWNLIINRPNGRICIKMLFYKYHYGRESGIIFSLLFFFTRFLPINLQISRGLKAACFGLSSQARHH